MVRPKTYYQTWFSKFFLFFIILLLGGCQSKISPYIKATEEFYINDRSHVLLNASAWTIYTYSEELYNDSQAETYKDQGLNGTQVVVTTYVGDPEDFDSTELYNAWGIGDNDMGLLLILYFDKVEDEFIYKVTDYVFGLGMMNYISAFRMSELINQYFNDANIPSWDYDMRLISLYFAILEEIYLKIYNYNSYNYQSYIDEYEENKYEFFSLLPSDYEKEPLPTWAIVLIIIGSLVAVGAFPTSLLLPFLFSFGGGNKGGRGKSGGYWFRR